MYRLFTQAYPEFNVKKDVYYSTFNTEFNLAFHKPKKDLCYLCQEYKDKENDQKILQHRESKLLTRQERKCNLAKVANGD